jgi:hypothetical protein
MRKVIRFLLHASKSHLRRIEAAPGALVKLASQPWNRPFALKLKALSRRVIILSRDLAEGDRPGARRGRWFPLSRGRKK